MPKFERGFFANAERKKIVDDGKDYPFKPIMLNSHDIYQLFNPKDGRFVKRLEGFRYDLQILTRRPEILRLIFEKYPEIYESLLNTRFTLKGLELFKPILNVLPERRVVKIGKKFKVMPYVFNEKTSKKIPVVENQKYINVDHSKFFYDILYAGSNLEPKEWGYIKRQYHRQRSWHYKNPWRIPLKSNKLYTWNLLQNTWDKWNKEVGTFERG